MPALLNEKSVAHRWQISASTLQHARTDRPTLKAPPHVRVGGRVFYDAESTARWMSEAGIPLRTELEGSEK